MAITLTQLRSSLATKVFNSTVATDVTITPTSRTASSDGGFTPGTESDGSSITIKGIPYSNSNEKFFKEMFGNSTAGEGTCIVPYDTTVSIGDKIEWESQTYIIQETEEFIYGNGVAAIQLLCNEDNS